MKELLDEYRATAAALRARRENLERQYRAGELGARADALRRYSLINDMYLDALLTVREIEDYLA